MKTLKDALVEKLADEAEREAQELAWVNHLNVKRQMDAAQEKMHRYIAMYQDIDIAPEDIQVVVTRADGASLTTTFVASIQLPHGDSINHMGCVIVEARPGAVDDNDYNVQVRDGEWQAFESRTQSTRAFRSILQAAEWLATIRFQVAARQGSAALAEAVNANW